MNSEKYSFAVKSYNSKEGKRVAIGGNEYYLAKRDSKYELHAHNESDDKCDVSISAGGTYIGTWPMNAQTTLTIKKEQHSQRELLFNHTPILSRTSSDAGDVPDDNCTRSLITALFVPHANCLTRCMESYDESGNPITMCYKDVDIHGVVKIQVPIMICEHNL